MKKHLPLLLALTFLVSCGGPETPKPRGLFRIALPERSFQQFDAMYPYRFEYPVYARFVPDTRDWAEPYWADIVFEDFNARLHLSYKPVNNQSDLFGYIEDAHTFVHRHIPKAISITDETFINPMNGVYATLVRIRGREAASAIQFWASDSLNHFLRGALYFNISPDNDSLAPVIQLLEEDIRHLLHTLEWD